MYTIFLDKPKIFECDIKIEGTSLEKSEARLFLETENFTLSFKGDITPAGKVKIPINKLRGVVQEGFTGKILLEIIAEDTVFHPWESEFHADLSKKVSVEVNEGLAEEFVIKPKPKITFKLKDELNESVEAWDSISHVISIFNILEKNSIDPKDLIKGKEDFNALVESYCEDNNIKDPKDIKRLKEDVFKKL